MNTLRHFTPLILLSLLAAAPVPTVAPHGEYVEARTASVFAGACHYNGERVTEGRSAVLAWRIDGGTFNNVDLTNVRIAAAIACDDNLAEASAARRTAIVVDAETDAKAAAAVAWLESRVPAAQLGRVVDVRRAPVAFAHASDAFTVSVDRFATMSIHAMPDRACCSQPELVWYQPMMPLDGRRVGYTESARLDATTVGLTWQRADENSAFYGTFAR